MLWLIYLGYLLSITFITLILCSSIGRCLQGTSATKELINVVVGVVWTRRPYIVQQPYWSICSSQPKLSPDKIGCEEPTQMTERDARPKTKKKRLKETSKMFTKK